MLQFARGATVFVWRDFVCDVYFEGAGVRIYAVRRGRGFIFMAERLLITVIV